MEPEYGDAIYGLDDVWDYVDHVIESRNCGEYLVKTQNGYEALVINKGDGWEEI